MGAIQRISQPGALPVPPDHRGRAVALFNEYSQGQLSEASVRSFFAALKGGSIRKKDGSRFRPNTVASYVAALKSAIKQSSDSIELHQKLDVLFRKAAPKVEKAIDRDETLSPEELRKLEASASPKLKATLRFLGLSGLRISEALSIELSDCEIKKDRVRLSILGKGNKARKVDVPRTAFDAVREAFQSQRVLFQNHHHRARNGHYTRQRFWQLITEHSEEALGRRIHPHTLRHANATALLAAGATLKEVSVHLGHAQVSTTAAIYDENRLQFQSILELEQVFNGKATKQRRKQRTRTKAS